MLQRRTLLRAAAASVALPAAARAAPAGRAPFRILAVQWRGETEADRGMRAYLRDANIRADFIVRDAQQDHEKLPAILAEAKSIRPDLVYTFGTEATLGMAGAFDADPAAYLNDIPLVFAAVGDPVAARLVRQIKESGRNLTGVIHLPPVDVQFEALVSFFEPQRVGVLYNKGETYGSAAVAQFETLVRKSGREVFIETCNGSDGRADAQLIGPALGKLAAAKIDVLYIPSTSFFIPLAGQVTDAAAAYGLPAFCANEQLIRGGQGLAGLIAPPAQVGAFAGHKIEQILANGKHAGDLPIEAIARFVLLINMPVSLELGVYPPITMLRYAEIIRGA